MSFRFWFLLYGSAERTYHFWCPHFVEVFARRMAKEINHVPPATMGALIEYGWPGNVRELQNLIERAVIRSDNEVLANPLASSRKEDFDTAIVLKGTFVDSERGFILRALEASGGTIGGPQGAAARLGLKRTTLVSKMKRLGINQSWLCEGTVTK